MGQRDLRKIFPLHGNTMDPEDIWKWKHIGALPTASFCLMRLILHDAYISAVIVFGWFLS
jgi:hypothetical protein